MDPLVEYEFNFVLFRTPYLFDERRYSTLVAMDKSFSITIYDKQFQDQIIQQSGSYR